MSGLAVLQLPNGVSIYWHKRHQDIDVPLHQTVLVQHVAASNAMLGPVHFKYQVNGQTNRKVRLLVVTSFRLPRWRPFCVCNGLLPIKCL